MWHLLMLLHESNHEQDADCVIARKQVVLEPLQHSIERQTKCERKQTLRGRGDRCVLLLLLLLLLLMLILSGGGSRRQTRIVRGCCRARAER